jgi:hypothetical protein
MLLTALLDHSALAAFNVVFWVVAMAKPWRAALPRTGHYEVAQGAVTMVHTLTLVVAPAVELFTPLDLTWFSSFGLTYFIWDTITILCFTYTKKRLYLLHHAVTIGIVYGTFPSVGWYAPEVIRDLYWLAEISNIFLTAWTIVRANRRHSPACQRVYRWLAPAFALSYIPVRVAAVPWAAWRVIDDTFARRGRDVAGAWALSAPIALIGAMSVYFSGVIGRGLIR